MASSTKEANQKVTSTSKAEVKEQVETEVLMEAVDDEELGEEEEEDLTAEELAELLKKPCFGIRTSFLLDKNTPSFRCLAQQLVSRSSLLRNPLYFPPLVEDGSIEAAFNYVAPEPEYDEVGVAKYLTVCKELNIVPMSRVINSLNQDVLDLKYYGLTVKQMRAVTATLKINTYIKTLILEDNWMNAEQSSLIGDMLMENSSIRYLNMKECRIGPVGAEMINEGLMSTQFITDLDLSHNSLGNEGIANMKTGLMENTSIKRLNISHNNLDEGCAGTLQLIVMSNMSLEELDLSWNCFNTGPGNKALFGGLMKSDRIKSLNLAWNGMTVKKCVTPLTKYLKETQNLQHLNLSDNRIASAALRNIKSGVGKNKSLEYIKLGNNPYTAEEGLGLASVLANKTDIPLKHMDLENIFLQKEFLSVHQKIKQIGKKITIGGVLSNYPIYGPNENKLLFERIRYLAMKPKKKKAQKDFGHFILSLPEKNQTRSDFETLLKKFKIKKLDKDLILALENKFSTKGKKVNVTQLRDAYMSLYPDTALPPPKPKKKKGKKGKKHKGVSTADLTEEGEVKTKSTVSFYDAKKENKEEMSESRTKMRNSVGAILKETLSGNIRGASTIMQKAMVENIEQIQVIAKRASCVMQKAIVGDTEFEIKGSGSIVSKHSQTSSRAKEEEVMEIKEVSSEQVITAEEI